MTEGLLDTAKNKNSRTNINSSSLSNENLQNKFSVPSKSQSDFVGPQKQECLNINASEDTVKEHTGTSNKIKLFNRWECESVEVRDPGLKRYIGLKPVILPRTHGRHASQQFHKSNINIVERLINRLMIPGHRGRKHLISSGMCAGQYTTIYTIVKDAFEKIEKNTKKNPIEVYVRAIENAALREEITAFRLGGIVGRKAVITSPQRRIDLTLRLITQAAYQKAHGKSKGIASALADEILACYNNDSQKANAIRERERIEREAAGAR